MVSRKAREASSSPSSLPSDTPGLSVWANRLHHHLAWLRKEWSSLEDISMQDINDFLVRTTAEAGKYFYLMDAPTNQPWVASVAMHAVVCDHPAVLTYTLQQKTEAWEYMKVAQTSGWNPQDIIQAAAWTRDCFPNFPTDVQWASLLDCSPEQVNMWLNDLAPTVEDALTPQEREAWSIAESLGAPFSSWVDLLKSKPYPLSTLALPSALTMTA